MRPMQDLRPTPVQRPAHQTQTTPSASPKMLKLWSVWANGFLKKISWFDCIAKIWPTQVLKDMGIEEFEPRVINQLLEFSYRYITNLLEDAKAFSNHAGKKSIDSEDIKMAIKSKVDYSFTTTPPRDVDQQQSIKLNTKQICNFIYFPSNQSSWWKSANLRTKIPCRPSNTMQAFDCHRIVSVCMRKIMCSRVSQ